MAHLLMMPEIAANAVKATLGNWLIAGGTVFTSGQSLAVVETEKAAVDLPTASLANSQSGRSSSTRRITVGSELWSWRIDRRFARLARARPVEPQRF